MIRRAWLIGIFVCVTGCAQHFTRVDFKYDSNAHLRPANTVVQFAGTPAQAIERAATFATENHGTITKRGQDRPPKRIAFPTDADVIWQNKRAIDEQEWHTFEKDDPNSYFAINRSSPMANRKLLEVRHDAVVTSVSMRIQFPPRQAQQKIERNLGPLVPVWWTEVHTIDISPVLYVFAWQGSDGKTWVYARATPRIGNLEAGAPRAWCAYQLWTASTGYQEAMLVRDLLDSLR